MVLMARRSKSRDRSGPIPASTETGEVMLKGFGGGTLRFCQKSAVLPMTTREWVRAISFPLFPRGAGGDKEKRDRSELRRNGENDEGATRNAHKASRLSRFR